MQRRLAAILAADPAGYSRLQEIAEPDGVVVPNPVCGALDGTLRPSLDGHGARNIERPLRLRVRSASAADPALPSRTLDCIRTEDLPGVP